MPKTVLVLNDLHVGSEYGICPEGLQLQSGSEWPLTEGQKYLLKCWDDLYARVKQFGKIDALILNGDLIEGRQTKQLATEAFTTDLSVQQEGAIKLLKPFADMSEHIYVVRGTEYHDQVSGESLETIGKELGAEKNVKGRYGRNSLDVIVDSVSFNVAHRIGVTSGMYRATLLDKAMLFAAFAKIMKNRSGADVVIRSHAHFFAHVELVHHHGFITPCWQLQTPYMIRIEPNRMLPDIGAVIIRVDGGKENPVFSEKAIYSLPPQEVENV